MIALLNKTTRIVFCQPFTWRLERRIVRRARGAESSDAGPGPVWAGVEECHWLADAYCSAIRRGLATVRLDATDFSHAETLLKLILLHAGGNPPVLRRGYIIQRHGSFFVLHYFPDHSQEHVFLGSGPAASDALTVATWHRAFSAEGQVGPGEVGKLLFSAAAEIGLIGEITPAPATGAGRDQAQ